MASHVGRILRCKDTRFIPLVPRIASQCTRRAVALHASYAAERSGCPCLLRNPAQCSREGRAFLLGRGSVLPGFFPVPLCERSRGMTARVYGFVDYGRHAHLAKSPDPMNGSPR